MAYTLTAAEERALIELQPWVETRPLGEQVPSALQAFLDMERHHRIDLNLQNVFDEDYTSQLATGIQDVGGAAYVAQFRGLPRTLSVHYTYNFF